MPVNGSGNPVFLEACQDYLDYLDRGKKRDLKLPEYETVSTPHLKEERKIAF